MAVAILGTKSPEAGTRKENIFFGRQMRRVKAQREKEEAH